MLQQAIVLEMSDALFNSWEISIEGKNGQLPKLDIYWLASYVVKHVLGLPSTLGKGVLESMPVCNQVTGMAKVIETSSLDFALSYTSTSILPECK